ncbi:hypothetical protein B0H10DRAFT_1948048 [Mycena sp. CBHHK59/15]|nr:hypothetical protein B0H10DRAFT_1948048 [Mycena sp. CBHHK59/15]
MPCSRKMGAHAQRSSNRAFTSAVLPIPANTVLAGIGSTQATHTCNGHNYSKIKLPAVPGAHKNLGKPTIHALQSVSKRIQAKVEKDGKKHTACKGAPTHGVSFAGKGFCSLGIATEEDGKDWKLFRIMSMFNPPAAENCKQPEWVGCAQFCGSSRQWV